MLFGNVWNQSHPFLTDASRKTASRDLGLLRDNLDIEGQSLKEAMVRFFIKKNPEWNLLELRATCLVGFNQDAYPCHVDLQSVMGDASIQSAIASWSSHLETHVNSHLLASFEIEFFMLPFQDVSEFRDLMLAALGGETNG